MKTIKLIIICAFFMIVFTTFMLLNSCDKEAENDGVIEEFQINNLNQDNFPKVDGSTSTEPLQIMIASKLLGVECKWIYSPAWFSEYPFHMAPLADKNPEAARFIYERIHHQGTHSSYFNLCNKYADMILVARNASADELHLADSLDVTLIETPVALDAFIFLVNKNNMVNSLTTKQIQDIYTGEIAHWNQVAGSESKIQAYIRDRNSGSQELMESLVMNGLPMIKLPDMMIEGMMGLVNRIEFDKSGLGYSVYYYTKYMIRSDSIKMLAIDGIYPDYENLKSKKYNYTAEVYAVIRSDLDTASTAYKLYNLLLSPAGQNLINESGYIPYYH